ncbi:hypothetical protein QBC35DRAFT_486219 [Podospora australis]|uniref:Uncharacterized protein n=1 Tax=Podospora australis TaxID=1536484 RepID=A0AAN6X1F5_9PEZI|nr:hypothetical protein QBC35DRAFT_486219 [Podospora australis]
MDKLLHMQNEQDWKAKCNNNRTAVYLAAAKDRLFAGVLKRDAWKHCFVCICYYRRFCFFRCSQWMELSLGRSLEEVSFPKSTDRYDKQRRAKKKRKEEGKKQHNKSPTRLIGENHQGPPFHLSPFRSVPTVGFLPSSLHRSMDFFLYAIQVAGANSRSRRSTVDSWIAGAIDSVVRGPGCRSSSLFSLFFLLDRRHDRIFRSRMSQFYGEQWSWKLVPRSVLAEQPRKRAGQGSHATVQRQQQRDENPAVCSYGCCLH